MYRYARLQRKIHQLESSDIVTAFRHFPFRMNALVASLNDHHHVVHQGNFSLYIIFFSKSCFSNVFKFPFLSCHFPDSHSEAHTTHRRMKALLGLSSRSTFFHEIPSKDPSCLDPVFFPFFSSSYLMFSLPCAARIVLCMSVCGEGMASHFFTSETGRR